jgi:hypothetical protein
MPSAAVCWFTWAAFQSCDTALLEERCAICASIWGVICWLPNICCSEGPACLGGEDDPMAVLVLRCALVGTGVGVEDVFDEVVLGPVPAPGVEELTEPAATGDDTLVMRLGALLLFAPLPPASSATSGVETLVVRLRGAGAGWVATLAAGFVGMLVAGFGLNLAVAAETRTRKAQVSVW